MVPTSSHGLSLWRLLTLSEKCSRHLREFVHSTTLDHLNEFRDLLETTLARAGHRHHRHRKPATTMLALGNRLRHIEESGQQFQAMTGQLLGELQEIQQRVETERRRPALR